MGPVLRPDDNQSIRQVHGIGLPTQRSNPSSRDNIIELGSPIVPGKTASRTNRGSDASSSKHRKSTGNLNGMSSALAAPSNLRSKNAYSMPSRPPQSFAAASFAPISRPLPRPTSDVSRPVKRQKTSNDDQESIPKHIRPSPLNPETPRASSPDSDSSEILVVDGPKPRPSPPSTNKPQPPKAGGDAEIDALLDGNRPSSSRLPGDPPPARPRSYPALTHAISSDDEGADPIATSFKQDNRRSTMMGSRNASKGKRKATEEDEEDVFGQTSSNFKGSSFAKVQQLRPTSAGKLPPRFSGAATGSKDAGRTLDDAIDIDDSNPDPDPDPMVDDPITEYEEAPPPIEKRILRSPKTISSPRIKAQQPKPRPSSVQAIPKGIVGARKSELERESTSHSPNKRQPQIDSMLVSATKPSRKAAMQGKTATTRVAEVASVIKPTPAATFYGKQGLSSGFHEGGAVLHIRRWFYGVLQFCVPADTATGSAPPKWSLQWTKEKLMIRENKKAGMEIPLFSVKVSDIMICEHTSTENHPVVITLKLRDTAPAALPHFTPVCDIITIEFFLENSSWNDKNYKALIQALKLTTGDHKVEMRTVIQSIHLLEVAEMKAQERLDKAASKESAQEVEAPALPRKVEPRAEAPKTRSQIASSSRKETLVEKLVKSSSSKPSSTTEDDDVETEEEEDEKDKPRRSTRNKKPAQSANDTERILSYPPVDIIRSDLSRLEPDEFLNDTLIEFGLKYWMNELKARDPALWDQIWVFNSFFYKKLSVKNFEEGYSQVRKWTAKVKIFEKKYLIIPINEHLHWYLAIIYRPENILRPAPPAKEAPQRSTRARPATALTVDIPKAQSGATSPSDVDMENTSDGASASDAMERAEVDAELKEPIVSVDTPSWPGINDDGVSSTRMTSVSSTSAAQDTVTDVDGDTNMTDEPGQPEQPQVSGKEVCGFSNHEEDPLPGEESMDLSSVIPPEEIPLGDDDDDPPPDSAAEPTNADGLQEPLEPDEKASAVEDDDPSTYIFIMDSLGGKHDAVTRTLKNWLKAEALDKLQRSDTREASGHNAPVPYQTNHVDCGLYLLHFAETFMKRPVEFKRLLVSRKRKSTAASVRDMAWNKHVIKTKRQDLKTLILDLAKDWKATQIPDVNSKKNVDPGSRQGSSAAAPAEPAGAEDMSKMIKQQERLKLKDHERPPQIKVTSSSVQAAGTRNAESSGKALDDVNKQDDMDWETLREKPTETPEDDSDIELLEVVGPKPKPARAPRSKRASSPKRATGLASRLR